MSGTFTNWPRIVDRALEVERLPSLAVLMAGSPPRSAESRLTRSDADEIWALVDELPLSRPFGITMARVVDYADFEELGLGLAAITSVRAVTEFLERYQRLLSDAMVVEAHDDGPTVSLTIETHGAAHWRVHEFGAALCARLVRGRFGARADAARLELAVPHRHPVADYARYFRCPVELVGARTRITFPAELRSPGALPDRISEGLGVVLGDALRRLAATPSDQARAELYRLLPTGDGSIGAVAARLHVSERTLQRQLADDGTSFREIRDQVASGLALRWVREGSQSTSEIAYRLGYQSPSTFARAFRRWHGQTPTQVRASRK